MRIIHPRVAELDQDGIADLYAYPPDRPWLRANFVSTLDGSAQGTDGRSGTINGPADHLVFQVNRALAEVILVGAQTTRTEGYKPVRPEPWQRGQVSIGVPGLAPLPLQVWQRARTS